MKARKRENRSSEAVISESVTASSNLAHGKLGIKRTIIINVFVISIVLISALFFIWRVAPYLIDNELRFASNMLDNANKNIQNFYDRISGNNVASRSLLEVSPTLEDWQLHGKIGLGKDGQPLFKLRELDDYERANMNFDEELKRGGGFNVRLSEATPLDRKAPSHRPKQCPASYVTDTMPRASVVIIFHNESPSILLRSVHSILNYTNPELLEEIILVNDGSDMDYSNISDGVSLQGYLEALPKTRLINLPERNGIVLARTAGIEAAKSPVFVILDSHIEVQPMWLEPLLARIQENPNTIVLPLVDTIDNKSLELREGGIGAVMGMIWILMEHSIDPSDFALSTLVDRLYQDKQLYVSTPTMSGGLFAMTKELFFDKLGGYDKGLTFWGAENIEISLRAWMCHARIETALCSRVYHMFRSGGSAYRVPGGSVVNNRLRVAAGWLDEYGDFAARVISGKPLPDTIDVSSIKEFRKANNCNSFQWYLDNVWPESYIRSLRDVPYMGQIHSLSDLRGLTFSSSAKSGEPLELQYSGSSPMMYLSAPRLITSMTDDEECLTSSAENGLVSKWCASGAKDSTQYFAVYPMPSDKLSEAVTSVDCVNGYCESARAALLQSIDKYESVMIADHFGRCLQNSSQSLILAACSPSEKSVS